MSHQCGAAAAKQTSLIKTDNEQIHLHVPPPVTQTRRFNSSLISEFLHRDDCSVTGGFSAAGRVFALQRRTTSTGLELFLCKRRPAPSLQSCSVSGTEALLMWSCPPCWMLGCQHHRFPVSLQHQQKSPKADFFDSTTASLYANTSFIQRQVNPCCSSPLPPLGGIRFYRKK